MLLLIDNYDSFVHNLARYFVELGCESRVVRNDAVSVSEIRDMAPSAIIISPGPCTPAEAGISVDLIRTLGDSIPMLGVCLGHQAIAAALGGQIIRAREPVHGRTSWIRHSAKELFEALPNPLRATRYHSLIIDESTLPKELVVTARTDDGVPMAVAHRSQPVFGVQFHPESVLTQCGRTLLGNFLRMAGLAFHGSPVEDWSDSVDSNDSSETQRGPITW
jgi:anthranilate synthase/aminodeoxychorismate synthase-like glutamine amidotransferase